EGIRPAETRTPCGPGGGWARKAVLGPRPGRWGREQRPPFFPSFSAAGTTGEAGTAAAALPPGVAPPLSGRCPEEGAGPLDPRPLRSGKARRPRSQRNDRGRRPVRTADLPSGPVRTVTGRRGRCARPVGAGSPAAPPLTGAAGR